MRANERRRLRVGRGLKGEAGPKGGRGLKGEAGPKGGRDLNGVGA